MTDSLSRNNQLHFNTHLDVRVFDRDLTVYRVCAIGCAGRIVRSFVQKPPSVFPRPAVQPLYVTVLFLTPYAGNPSKNSSMNVISTLLDVVLLIDSEVHGRSGQEKT